MAKKKLGSIVWPNLPNDTYILDAGKVEYDKDGTYDDFTAGRAIQRKADVDGAYPDLTAGTANQINTSVRANDKTPYLFRTSGGSVDIGDREYANGIVGGTIAWNQLCNGSSVAVQSGHKYYLLKGGVASVGSSSGSAITGLTSGTDMVIDLTQLFGSTIADYIYSLETATAGAGVNFFKKLFPNMDAEYTWLDAGGTSHTQKLRDFQAGILQSVSGLQSHDMTGFNQFDKSTATANSTINATGGITSGSYYVSDFIKVVPNTDYYIKDVETIANARSLVFYDYDKNLVSIETVSGSASEHAKSFVKHIPNNVHNIRIVVNPSYIDTACINLAWDNSRNGEYEPYEKHSYPLDSDITLRGLFKLDANNNLYADGDIYPPSGEVSRKYGEMTVSADNVTSVSTSSTGIKYASIDATGHYNSNGSLNVLSTRGYKPCNNVPSDSGWIRLVGNVIYVYDNALTDLATAKNLLNGMGVVYEKTTPTTETADPYTSPQIVNDFGTEEYVISDNVFAVPVGHDTDYPINMVAKLEMAPSSPSGDGDYIVRQTNGTNEYVSLAGNATIQDIISRLEALENA